MDTSKWFAQNAVRRFHGLEGTKLLAAFNSEELPVPKPPEIWLLAMITLILIKITDSKKEAMLIAIRYLKQVVPQMTRRF